MTTRHYEYAYDTQSVREEIRRLRDRLDYLEKQLKETETADVAAFLNRVPNGTTIIFDKPMPNGKIYTYAVVRAAYSWYSTARMDNRRNPTTNELMHFILGVNPKYRVKKIRLVSSLGFHDEYFSVPQ